MTIASVSADAARVEQSFAHPNRRRPDDPRRDERELKARLRRLHRANAALARRKRAERRARIAAILEQPAAKRCRCPGMRPGITDDELRALGAGCTAPRWVCGTLDAVRRAVGL